VENTNRIKLLSGQTIFLKELCQTETYGGLLEGLPTREMNKRILERIHQKYSASLSGLFMLQPIETLIQGIDSYPFGTPALIPSIQCVACFRALEPTRNKFFDYSELTIVWFQKNFALPIDPIVLQAIQSLDWENHATDFEY
jgi:hypothetical protein